MRGPLVSVLIAALVVQLGACVARKDPIASQHKGSAGTMPADAIDPVREDAAASMPRREQTQAPGPAGNHIAVTQGALSDHVLARAGIVSTPVLAVPCCASAPSVNAERYAHLAQSPVQLVAESPVSTFSIDVDTGSYANVRRFLTAGQLPAQDAIRVEELVNYFDFEYPAPDHPATPFRISTELAQAPWNEQAWLLRIGLRAYAVPAAARPAANLVFLLDVSGSMQAPEKLPLLKSAFRLLTGELGAADRVGIVVYAGASGVVLEPTPGDQSRRILEALEHLQAGGSTNGGSGIALAYALARQSYIEPGINRVILATDGDFNVGLVDFEALVDLAERERKSGIALTTLGFGTGNYNDHLLERLADAGDGTYAYVDTLREARKVLVDEVTSTLLTIARDVKIQVEFNAAQVAEYRLIGYDNRSLEHEDFNNDAVDAGDIGAGHRVTALYELIPVGRQGRIDKLRYAGHSPRAARDRDGEIAFLRLRYKEPGADRSRLLEYPLLRRSLLARGEESADFRFAASVAAFGQKLRGGRHLGNFGYDAIRALGEAGATPDPSGYRQEYLMLVDRAWSLEPAATSVSGGSGAAETRLHRGSSG